MKIADRFREIRHQLRYERKDLAEVLGVNTERITSIENGKVQKLTAQEVEIIVGLGFNRQWVLTGEGDVYPDAQKIKLDELRKVIRDQEAKGRVKANFDEETAAIPYYRNVTPSAGHGLEIYNEEPDGEIKTLIEAYGIPEKQAKNIAIMYVSGYSMSPKLENGDGLLVNISNTSLSGECMYVVRWQESLLVKIIQRLKNGIRLISINPDFAPIDLVEDECEDLQIIGRVVGTFARL